MRGPGRHRRKPLDLECTGLPDTVLGLADKRKNTIILLSNSFCCAPLFDARRIQSEGRFVGRPRVEVPARIGRRIQGAIAPRGAARERGREAAPWRSVLWACVPLSDPPAASTPPPCETLTGRAQGRVPAAVLRPTRLGRGPGFAAGNDPQIDVRIVNEPWSV